MKSCFILLFMYLYLHVINTNAENGSDNYEPYMDIVNPNSISMKTFRFGDLKQLQNIYYIKMHMCPAETEADIANLEHASKYFYKIKYCLFKKVFQTYQGRICKKEVKPVFHKTTDKETGKVRKCGYIKHPHISLHAFSFYSCGETDVSHQFQNEITRDDLRSWKYHSSNIKVYNICYDTFEKQVIWTKHTILTPQLFQNPYLKNQQLFGTEISADSYFMDKDTFLFLKNEYDREKMKDTSTRGNYRMTPQPLVPPQHFAILHWKKATNHYINMAPLWEKLVPLMTAIDEGIKRAQLKLESKVSKSRKPKLYDDLIVLTKVTTPIKADTALGKWFNLSLFKANIWYKLIFRMGKKLAVLIIIHNTPGNPPLKGCLVGKQKKCQFHKWTRDNKIRRSIADKENKYAYCCKIGRNDARNLFYDFVIKGYFEIDALITKGEDVLKS